MNPISIVVGSMVFGFLGASLGACVIELVAIANHWPWPF